MHLDIGSLFAAHFFWLLVNFAYPCQPFCAACDVVLIVSSDLSVLLSFFS